MKLLRVLLLAAIGCAAFGGTAEAKFVHFTSPSGNIDCLGETRAPSWVQCLVERSSWPRKPRRPASCDLDWAPTQIELQRRTVRLGSCRGDVGPLCGPASAGMACVRLGYGRSVNIGSIRCTSATNGVTCRQRAKPRVGFRIAREGYVIFPR